MTTLSEHISAIESKRICLAHFEGRKPSKARQAEMVSEVVRQCIYDISRKENYMWVGSDKLTPQLETFVAEWFAG